MRSGVVCRQAQQVRRDRRDAAGQTDERRDALERDDGLSDVECGVDVPRGGRDLVVGGRVGHEVSLGHPDTADVDRAGGLDVVGAADELGRAAAEVDDEVGPGDALGREAARRTGERQCGLLVTGDDLGRDLGAEVLDEGRVHALDEVRGVARVAGRRGGDEAHVHGAQLTARGGILPRDGERALHRLGGDDTGAVDPVAEADDLHPAQHVGERPCLRVDVGDEQADRVGAAVDRADADGPVTHPWLPRRRRPRPRAGLRTTSAATSRRASRGPRRRAG